MILSEREKLILTTLLKSNESLSIKDIVKLTKIKERTLYREIKNLEYSLSNSEVNLIKEKSKYKLIGDLSSLDNSLLSSNLAEQAYSQETRLNLILCFLILNNQTSIKDISEKLLISYNTVATTITTIEKIITDYKLTLKRKKGLGITLKGEEVDKRMLLISLLYNEISDSDFFTKLNKNKKDIFINNPFIKFLHFDFLSNLFFENKNLEVFSLYTDSSIKKILISVNVILLRISIPTECHEKYSEKEEIYAEKLLEITKKYVDLNINDSTKFFLIKILKTCRLIEQLSYFNDKYSYTLVYKINLLIKNVGKRINLDFSQDTNLASGLIAHVESAIKRYQMKLKEENEDLLNFVLQNYNELYLVVKSELLSVFSEINFNSTELSYIVIHFASSYEQIYRQNFIRALVICSSGIGSSKILGSQIRKNIPEIKNVEYSIPSKLTDELINNYDVIISTIELDKKLDYILIPTILKEQDINTIKEKILTSRSFKRNNAKTKKEKKSLEQQFITIEKILSNIKVNETSLTNINKILTASLTDFDLNKTHTIVKNLIDRHNKSSIVIPNTNIALFHTLENSLTKPLISISYLENEIELINVSDKMENVSIFFTMISPNIEDYTDLLGQISIAILNDIVLKDAIYSKNYNFLITKLELIMKNYILNNTTE